MFQTTIFWLKFLLIVRANHLISSEVFGLKYQVLRKGLQQIKSSLKNIIKMLKLIPGREFDPTGKVLLISAASTGGIGTLVLDTFIINNGFQRVGFFDTKMLEPCVGLLPSRIQKETLGLPAQFYLKGDLLILQLRSRNRKGRKQDFVKEISALADKYVFSEIIIVSSLSNSSRPDHEIRSHKKNIYVKVKGQSHLKTAGSQPFENLYDPDEKDVDEDEILQDSGLCTKAFKVLPRVVAFFIFSDPVWDVKTADVMAKGLRQILGFKEIGEQITYVPEDDRKF